LPKQWVAHWSNIKRPEQTPLYGYQIEGWWSAPEHDTKTGTAP